MIPCTEYNKTHLVKYYLITEWSDIPKISREMEPNWLFRGQSNAKWKLTTSLERKAGSSIADSENRKILECIRSATNYFPQPLPAATDYYAWLSLLQHHGVSTRLLDVTSSILVALFFALIDLKENEDACLWCIHPKVINFYFYNDLLAVSNPGHGIPLERLPEFTPAFAENQTAGIALANEYIYHAGQPSFISVPPNYKFDREKIVERYRRGGFLILPPQFQTKRSLAQQASFLFPINPEMSFERNMIGMLDIADPPQSLDDLCFISEEARRMKYSFFLSKFIIPFSLKNSFLHELKKANVTYLTLFPDLYGFTKTLS